MNTVVLRGGDFAMWRASSLALLIVAIWIATTETAPAQCYFLECAPGEPSSPAPPVGRDGGPPSFECRTHFALDEVAVCGNERLSFLDRKLTSVYVALRNGLNVQGQIKLRDEQRGWIRQRGLCKSDVPCLTRAYESRITQLENW